MVVVVVAWLCGCGVSWLFIYIILVIGVIQFRGRVGG